MFAQQHSRSPLTWWKLLVSTNFPPRRSYFLSISTLMLNKYDVECSLMTCFSSLSRSNSWRQIFCYDGIIIFGHDVRFIFQLSTKKWESYFRKLSTKYETPSIYIQLSPGSNLILSVNVSTIVDATSIFFCVVPEEYENLRADS